MRIYKLTIMASQLVGAVGSGRFNDISYEEVRDRIDDESIFDFLIERLEIGVPLSVLTPVDKLELLYEWSQLITCVEPLPFDGHRNGLCLLVAYILEGIQRRASNAAYRLTDETASKAFDALET